MKTSYLFFLMAVCTNLLIAQSNVVLKTSILDENFARSSNPFFSNQEYPLAFLRADYTIDGKDNIYIANPFTEKVYKYNNGTLVDEISLSERFVTIEGIKRVLISCDTKGSLYILFLNGEYFVGMEKYDKNCKKIDKFHLNFSENSYIKKFFINNNDQICIGTFPIILAPDNDTRLFCLYDENGKFIVRTNYPHVAADYYLNYSVENKNYLIEFIPKEQMNEPKDIKNTILFPFDNINDGIKYFIGCDANDNAYTLRDDEIIMYNLKNQGRKTFHINSNNDMYNDYMSYHLFMKAAPDGSVYILSIGAKNERIKPHTKYKIDELEFIIQKLN